MSARRPPVSVVMPFAGEPGDGAVAFAALMSIERAPGDELVVADNSAGQVLAALAARWPQITVVAATAQRSSYYARNVGAASAANDWLLFIDSDCEPTAGILDAYFERPPLASEGALAGEIDGDPSQRGLAARYARDRGHLGQAASLEHPFAPYAVTANLLVRRRALQSVGGFLEGIRSGGDTDFSWRLQSAGWTLGHRPEARVTHRHRESLRAFARAATRYAAGRAWLNRRYPGALPIAPLRSAARALASAVRWIAIGKRERGLFRTLDALVIVIDRGGALLSNRTQHAPPATELVVFTDTFPEVSETFIGAELLALRRLGIGTRVEARRRAQTQDLDAARTHATSFMEDESVLGRVGDLLWLALRHPSGCLRDLGQRRRWRAEELVVPLRTLAPAARRLERLSGSRAHAHFAAGAALDAMRVASIIGIPYSVTGHAYEIFREPRNLVEKLERADIVTSGCDYNVEYLRGLVSPAVRPRIHKIVMGVDGRRFSRDQPLAGRRRVIAVGRLVEKKGFEHLVAATALLERSDPIEQLTIVGDGPLRERLREQIESLGLQARVRLAGALDQGAVRAAMERSDLLAMPCVIAADGDRDSMPVVVKEALALELLVVATDQVGLPEVITPDWGRLVAPADPDALADAIAQLLALDPGERAAMGAAGRRFVLEHCNVDRETARLAQLLGLGAGAAAPDEVAGTVQSTSIR